ncbi:MAG TPA: hypothetical protein VHE30_14775 [Polyangiaceae bacterium]|nr:hypothetical protein [Polyangiaceae bacterium]
MTKRRAASVALLAGAVVAASVGYWRHRARAAAQHWVAPVLVDPAAGARTPSSEILGVRVGATRLVEVQRLTGAKGLSCADRSVRVLMGELRDKKRAEIAAAEAAGKPDAVSGASILTRKTARDENPQVRFSCDGVRSGALGDRARPEGVGRLLYVFDDANGPVRHASYQRNHDDWTAALADYEDARRALTEKLGPPRESSSMPKSGAAPGGPLPKYGRRVAEWKFSDVVATVSVGNLGGRGFSVSEALEVPLPLRPDAPVR